ncbi:Chloroperoxidase [Mycena belliarum]|uniref:Chloroperoxidase n=1 Tax=Mycena belliarum TaxID=1033014 RepID=A0AAD6U9J3_9AGAR|nr:Chloroperoxidase [Mycena belliae]
MPLLESAAKLFRLVYILCWDLSLTLVNLVTPSLKPGRIVPHESPGAGGKWPEFVPPKEGDSRCACPMLNALANHGILPHDGRNIRFTELTQTVRTSYNFASTFCVFVPRYAADLLLKNYKTDTFDLAELSQHNGIEHDASLTRQDAEYDPDQSRVHLPFVNALLACASGKDRAGHVRLTPADVSRYSSTRRAAARATNPAFTLSRTHKMFGSSNSSTLLTILGGRVADVEVFLKEERIPAGWEPRAAHRMGLTMLAFQRTVLKVECAIDEGAVLSEGDAE